MISLIHSSRGLFSCIRHQIHSYLPLPTLEPGGTDQLQYSMDDLGGSCSIKEDELPKEMPIEQEELDRNQQKL